MTFSPKISDHPLVGKLILAAILSLSAIAQASAQASGSNTTAIDIKEFSFAPSSIDVTNSSQTVTVTVRITDTERDFWSMEPYFRSPQTHVNYGFGSLGIQDRISGDGRDGVYRKELTIPQYLEAGKWEVSSLFVYDGTSPYYRWRDFSSSDLVARGFPTSLQVVNTNETVPPEITDFSFTPSAVDTTGVPRTISITVRARDAASGIYALYVGFANPPNCYYYDDECSTLFYVTLTSADRISGDDKDGVYRRVVTIPFNYPAEKYSAYVGAEDNVFNHTILSSSELAARGYPFRLRTFKTALFDFNVDGSADISLYRPSNQTWYLAGGSGGFTATKYGEPGDTPTPADFDGDGITDLAVFRPSAGTWYVSGSASGFAVQAWGQAGDIPVPADYDGDGKADIAVFRPSNGTWYRKLSSGAISILQFGTAEDKPQIGDFDGDGKADLAVSRPSNNTWYFLRTTAGFTAFSWGANGDIASPADYDADGQTDVAVFRPSTGVWFIAGSTSGFSTRNWGAAGDVPVSADYDGDGKADVAVFRPSNNTWYLLQSTSGIAQYQFGAAGDKAIPGVFIY